NIMYTPNKTMPPTLCISRVCLCVCLSVQYIEYFPRLVSAKDRVSAAIKQFYDSKIRPILIDSLKFDKFVIDFAVIEKKRPDTAPVLINPHAAAATAASAAVTAGA